jgi:CarD family transcriptional regulator
VFEVGDKVVYPHHGAGVVSRRERTEVGGRVREYLTIQILYNDMTVMVPADNAERAGLRRVISEDEVEAVLAVLRDDGSVMPGNWSRRFKHNREKIKTGDVFELAEVVRNLSIRDRARGLSTGEKQMLTRAKRILASELGYAREIAEEDACAFLDEVLDQSALARGGTDRPAPVAFDADGAIGEGALA